MVIKNKLNYNTIKQKLRYLHRQRNLNYWIIKYEKEFIYICNIKQNGMNKILKIIGIIILSVIALILIIKLIALVFLIVISIKDLPI